jgi:TonB-linked SusC/RagA family outer membrane protein
MTHARQTPFGRRTRASRFWRHLAVAGCMTLAAMIQPAEAQQQTGAIGGVVTTQAGEPIRGAQVMVVGTQRTTLTDASGRFIMTNVPAGERQIRVTALGYRSETQPVRVAVGETATVAFELPISAISLDEVVVTGTVGGTERRALGNTVTTVRASEVVDIAPIRDVQSLINARAPGVVITPGTGQVGSGSQIRIRGSSSISLNNTPLLYVDGVRVDNAQNTGPITQAFASRVISRINDFNPDDIESIEIIKGPAAATLYGTEAANGVIQIITRQGREGAPQWNMTVRQGANWFRNAEGRVPTNYWRSVDTGEIHSINFAQMERERGTPLWRTGHLQNYNLSLSGGTAEVRYHISGFMDVEEGPDWDNDLERSGARANITVMPSQTVQLAGNMGYTRGRFNLACEGGCGGVTWASYFSTPQHFGQNDPTQSAWFDEDGNHRRRGARSLPPEYYWNVTDRSQELGRFTGSVQLTHRPLDWFNHRLSFGVDDTRENDQVLTEINAIYQEWSPTGVGGKDVTRREVTNTTLDYGATVSMDVAHGITSRTSFGFQYYDRLLKQVDATGAEFALPGLRIIDATNPDRRGGSELFVQTVSLGMFGQQEFGWRDRVFLTLGLRADDHSAFGEEFDVVYYPKASATWVVSEEPFFRLPLVSDLRFRTAFGGAGEQPGAFDALRTFAAVAGPDGRATVTPASIGNPELGPEHGQEFEIGFDAGFLDGRAGLEFTYYRQRTMDAIVLQPVAPSTGFPGSRFINVGELRNFGLEATLRAQPVQTRNVTWDATFSLARNDSEVMDIGDQDQISVGFGVTHKPGYPIASWHHRRLVDAQFNTTNATIQDPVTNANVLPHQPIRSSMICDDGAGGTTPCYNNTGQLVAPMVYLGRSEPLFEGAFSSTVTLLNRLRVYGLVDFKTGFYKWDHVTRVRCSLNHNCPESRQASVNGLVDPSIIQSERFQNDPEYRALLASYQSGDIFGATYINNSSFLRFREISLSYMLPDQWAQRFGGSRATVTMAARNLGEITNWTGMDPEARFLGGARGLFGGLEQNHLPQSTSFVTSINFTF